PWTPIFLVCVLAAVLASEWRGRGRVRRGLRAVWVQALAAGLGIAVLRGPSLVDPDAVLFPLFSGLFGIPSLIVGLRARPGSIPYQRLEPLRGLSREDARSALRGTIAGASVSWLPGLSGGAAATLASVGTRRTVGPSQFMVVLGAVSTSTALLSVAVLFIIHRARSGAAAAVRGPGRDRLGGALHDRRPRAGRAPGAPGAPDGVAPHPGPAVVHRSGGLRKGKDLDAASCILAQAPRGTHCTRDPRTCSTNSP